MIKNEKCPECNSLIEHRIINHTQGWYCDNCGWNVVTTYFSPIEKDSNVYKVFIKEGITVNINQIKVISKLAGINFLSAKKLLGSGTLFIFEGRARDIFEKLILLSENDISYITEPPYPYKIDLEN